MLKITKETWLKIDKDYKGIDKETKQKYILHNNCLKPIEIDDENGCYYANILFKDSVGIGNRLLFVLYNPLKSKKENLYESLKRVVNYRDEWEFYVQNDLANENEIFIDKL